ncbi:MAG: biotin transporter BioY [Puniceicoccales bacterium]|jgi:biotin transport system substrate-specific component|nr:biotin transporter BioY [Puniceicoccales bacterium]
MNSDTGKMKVCVGSGGMRAVVRDLLVAVLCSLVVLAASHVRVPFYPVPFTMQTLAVVCVSLFAGRRLALWSLLLFVELWGVFFATGGYILGFFAVPFILGNNAAKLGSFSLLLRIFCSHLVVLAAGTAVLACFIGMKAAFIGGFLFFVPSEIFKGSLAFALARAVGKFSR